MSVTATTIRNKIQNLIDKANRTAGTAATNLTSAINVLIGVIEDSGECDCIIWDGTGVLITSNNEYGETLTIDTFTEEANAHGTTVII